MDYITSSYLDKNLTVTERVYRLWFSAFVFRIWRSWLKESATHTLEFNFISSNSYSCLEILAHSIILAIIKLRNENREHLFLPWLWTSQPCESYFRAARSLTSTESTQLNFTLKDFLVSRCPRIDASIHLTAKGCEDGIEYPRQKKAFDSANVEECVFIPKTLPTNEEIEAEVERGRRDAENTLQELGETFYCFKFDETQRRMSVFFPQLF